MKTIICSVMDEGDYIVENQTIDNANWIYYGKLAVGMPRMGTRLVFVATGTGLESLCGKSFATTEAFTKRAQAVLSRAV